MCRIIRGSRSRLKVALGFVLGLSLAGFSGCGSGERFSYVKVSGKVTYEDGSLIPADRINVTFVSQAPRLDPKTPPPFGTADVDPQTGTFDAVTSHTYGDGLMSGEYKVLIRAIKGKPKSSQAKMDLVPPEYADPDKTPLLVNTNKLPFDLKVRKPAPAKGKGK